MTLLWIIPLLVTQIWACTLPMFGHFGSYQAVNAMMAEMFGSNGFQSFFEPRVFSIQNGLPELHTLYVPYSAWLSRITQLGFHLKADLLPFLGRVYSLAAGIGGMVVVRKLAKHFQLSTQTSNLAALLFLITPMVSVVSVSFQNETWALFFLLISALQILKGVEKNKIKAVFYAGLFGGLAVTARVHFAFFLLPVIWVIFSSGKRTFSTFFTYMLGFLLPVVIWLGWFYYLEQMSGAVRSSIFTQSMEGRIGSWNYLFDVHFYLRIAKQIAFYWTLPIVWLFSYSIIKNKNAWFLWLWILASFFVIVILPRKVIDHPFYLIGGVPAFCILAANTIERWFSVRSKAFQIFAIGVSCFLALGIFLRFQTVSPESDKWLAQAKEIQIQIAKNDKIILQHPQAAAMLFYTHRLGWIFNADKIQSAKNHSVKDYGKLISWIEYLRSEGAVWLVVTDLNKFSLHDQFYDYVLSSYKLKKIESLEMLIFDLKEKK